MANLEQEIIDKAARVDAFMIIAPFIEASMANNQRISEQLEEVNVKSSFLDGFAAELEEGKDRQAARIRRSLGIRQEEDGNFNGEYYFNQMSGYPYKRRENV